MIVTQSSSLHILMLHNSYQYSGGEDVSTLTEVEMLREAGNKVTLNVVSNQEIQHYSLIRKIGLSISSAWSPVQYRMVVDQIKSIHPDLIHVQNFFPLLSPSIHSAAKSKQIPTVQHLRNFRLGCLSPYLYRDGDICEVCVGKSPWRGVMNQCYRDSFAASASIFGMISFNRFRDTWRREVDAFITPSHFAAQKLTQLGVPAERLYVKPNVVSDPLNIEEEIPSLPVIPRFIYVGRLSSEKGVMTLLNAWKKLNQKDWTLTIIGDGPQRNDVKQFISDFHQSNINMLGVLNASEVLLAMQAATAVIVPSQWYEVFGRVVVEAFACGRSVLASKLGALPELVTEGETGFLIPHQDINAWGERIKWCGQNPSEMSRMGKIARNTYLKNYTPDNNYQQMIHIYRQILQS